MKAILMTAPGTPDVLKLAEVETPTLTDDQPLLVRPKAAGGNPVDTKRREGTYLPRAPAGHPRLRRHRCRRGRRRRRDPLPGG